MPEHKRGGLKVASVQANLMVPSAATLSVPVGGNTFLQWVSLSSLGKHCPKSQIIEKLPEDFLSEGRGTR